MKDLNAALRNLTPEQRDLLMRRLAQEKGAGRPAEPERIPRQPRAAEENAFPLSFAQQRLWFLDRMGPGSPLYNIPAAFEISGPLDAAALEAALREVARRHESLRTTFAEASSGPVQVVHPRMDLPFAVADLRGLPAGERRAEAWRRAEEEARQPFDLQRGPLLRALLLRLSGEEHLVVLTIHHIVSDGWSMGVLVREIAALYPAFAAGQAPRLPELPIQYADFAVWQREWSQGGALDAQLAFWRERLAGAPESLELPTDHPRPAVQTVRGSQAPVRLGHALVAALRETARKEGGTLFMVILAAFELLLQHYTGRDEMLVGSPIANRNRPDVEGLIGFFVNTLAMRGDLRGEPTLRELLARVRETALAAYAHQDLPFERLIEELQPRRDLSRPPLVQVMAALQPAAAEALDLPGLRLRPVPMDSGTAKFEMTLHLAEGAEVVEGWIEYNADLFEPATVERMAAQLVALLEGVPAGLDRPAAELPFLPEDEMRALLAEGDGGPGEPLPAECLHRLFERTVRERPDAVAVTSGEERWTYRDLDRHANRLAHVLRERGVGPEVPVAICMEKTPRRLAALLGILKAGGAYVPLDPNHPGERLAFILEETATPWLLTESALLASLPERREGLLLLDGAWPGTPDQEAQGPPDGVTGDSLAYVIYTSGSTGRPKGVLTAHRGACRLVADGVQRLRLGPESRLPQNTSITFDASVFEMFSAFAVGARIVLFPSGLLGADLAAELRRHEATSMVITPGVLETLAPEEVPSVRAMTVGAEACPPELAARWSAVLDLTNCYGPTETTIYSLAWPCPPGVWEAPPIGRPVAGTRVYLLDRRMRPVPPGAHGEICLGGEGLARGYLDRPDLTAERFVPDPCSGVPGARLYHTGDLGRRREGGEIEFAGRNDAQVKLRGFRIELGEVEAALYAHPAIERAVAMVREDSPGIRRLVGYALPRPGEKPAGADLRAFLKTALPEYMVPAAVVVLDALPLNTNQKVDLKALPAPDGSFDATADFVVPRNDAERRIAAIWREVLQVERVGVNDSFFDLGGHSLLMARVHTRLREDFPGFDLALVDLFKYPTVGALAERLSATGEANAAARLGLERAQARRESAARAETGIAIVGMSCRFPGADSVERFWENLTGGVESISFFTEEQLRTAGVPESDIANPRYVRARGIVERPADFDAGFFGYSPREAELLDPQQRVFLECAWEAFEDAGIDPARFPGDVGVYAGVGLNTYVFNLLPDPEIRDSVGNFQLTISNDKDFVASRVSYKLGLRGPSLAVQTACSTSLVAAHLACQSLLSGECDAALAGGVSIRLPQETGYHHHEGAVFSPDGHCRAFDARAGGFVGGNGAGAVLLKRLEDALRDGDRIHAVIKGSAINNDGSVKVGYTAPSVDGQAQVIAQALAVAGVAPETVGYIEAHGTGTDLGDPIEIAALAQAFGAAATAGGCAIGSVKTNIGHLDSAAGVAGLIKAALVLERGVIPPSLHFEAANPKLELERTPFRVNRELAEWPAGETPRRAGVSSMGIGGTNAHIVLEEPPAAAPGTPGGPWQLLPLSARGDAALEGAISRLAEHLQRHPGQDLADVAFTLQTGRRHFERRAVALCRDAADAVAVLEGSDRERLVFGDSGDGDARSVAFLFSGQGAQHAGMAAELYRVEPVFRSELDRACELLKPILGGDLRDLLFGDGGEELARTEFTQPALFAVEHALARQWMAWGVRPEAMLGHSIGEYVAACLAGVFSFEDALALVAERGRLMAAMEPGAMLAVSLPESEVRPLLSEDLALAAVNGAERTVVAGPETSVAAFATGLESRGVRVRRLRTSHAFHSAMMEPALEPFAARVRRVRLSPPTIPFLSNVTGTWITAEQATDPEYWARHIRATVRFADGLAALREPGRLLLEVGPGNTLATLAREAGASAIASLPHASDRRNDHAFLLTALGRLWLAGMDPDWNALHVGERRLRVSLPTYAFQRQRYWVDGPGPLGMPARPAVAAASLAKRPDPADWLSVPTWKRSLPAPESEIAGPVLVVGSGALAEETLRLLRERGIDCEATDGQDFGFDRFQPRTVLHLRSVHQDDGFASLVALARAWGEQPLEIVVAASGLFEVNGSEEIRPEAATLLGPARVIPWEMPAVSCRVVDVSPDATAADLLRELGTATTERLSALRGRHCWTPVWEPVRLEDAPERQRIREDGVYLVTGGTGGLGLEMAAALAEGRRVRLALLSRRIDPAAVERLESLGAEVLPLAADVTDRAAMASALQEIRRRFGALHGVVHAAGARGGGVLQAHTAAELEAVMAPAVQGLKVLEGLLAGEALDFMVLTASAGAHSGEPGLAARSAADAFLDAWAQRQAAKPGAPYTVAVDWDTWRDVGMIADLSGLRDDLRRLREQALATGIAPAEGRAVFLRILQRGSWPQMIVSTKDPAAVRAHLEALARGEAIQDETAARAAYARPDLRNAYVAPRDETERVLAEIWQGLLGVERVGVDDNFFDLGGHSLLATQLMSRVRDALGVELPLDALFASPTVGGLSQAVSGVPPAEDAEDLDALLREIEEMSAAEAQAAYLEESSRTAKEQV